MRRGGACVLLCAFIAVGFLSCSNPIGSEKKTRVTLKAVNSTVLFSADQKMILCIHDEQNDSHNYSTYTTDRTVTFENVKPGRYIAHFGSEWVLGERALRIDVREGDRKTVVFEGYVFGYLNVLGSLYPYHKMKAYEL